MIRLYGVMTGGDTEIEFYEDRQEALKDFAQGCDQYAPGERASIQDMLLDEERSTDLVNVRFLGRPGCEDWFLDARATTPEQARVMMLNALAQPSRVKQKIG
jgi:hypothetical protein